MGLDISVVEKREIYGFRAGSYSGFNEWREKLASLVSIELDEMDGFGGNKEWEDNTKFIELLNHSDCEGILTQDECESLSNTFPPSKEGAFQATEPVLPDLVIEQSLRCFGCRDPEVIRASGTLVAL